MSSTQLYKQAMDVIPTSLLSSVKAIVTFLILFNIQSFPLVWHYNVMAKYFAWLAKSRFLGKIQEPVALSHPDARDATMVRRFRAWPTNCDAFGFHLSNSTYAAYADTVRGPHIYNILGIFFDLPKSTFALGSTTFDFKKEIPIMTAYTLTIQLLGYDKKWLYLLAKYTSKDQKGETQTHCLHLSHVVLKINGRRTVQPARAFALSGFGPNGKHNLAIVDKMTKKERIQWVIGEGPERDIKVGDVDFGLEKQGEWPGQFVVQQS